MKKVLCTITLAASLGAVSMPAMAMGVPVMPTQPTKVEKVATSAEQAVEKLHLSEEKAARVNEILKSEEVKDEAALKDMLKDELSVEQIDQLIAAIK
ncbi:hypothetical protein [Flexibacterium corallicola]|uniref:hypothetical protein n=1 Tax=Flexibacterium corallicola TaxID=3037259 RepID=UPI00286EE47B|nr:hypothetical protein [Pseudovibrio sp. M1P-2-3]